MDRKNLGGMTQLMIHCGNASGPATSTADGDFEQSTFKLWKMYLFTLI